MPHVQLEGTIDAAHLQRALTPAAEPTGAGVRKSRDAFLGRDGHTLLVETTVVEGGVNRSFLTRIERKQDGRYSVRIDPATPVERTAGVARSVAWIAARVLEASPGARRVHTNIPDAD